MKQNNIYHLPSRAITMKSGSALIAVFWIMAILSLAVFSAVRVVYYDADVAAAQLNGFEALQVAEKGIAVAVNPNIEITDPLLQWQDDELDLSYSAKFVSEGAKYNINVILARKDKIFLTNLFEDWGMDGADARNLVDNLVDWVDPDDSVELNGVERPWYESQGRTNHPFNRPFYNLDEVHLVKDMELLEEVKPSWKDWFTIWSSGKLNINEASAELIAAASEEISINDAELLLNQILGADGLRNTEDDVPFQSVEEALSVVSISDIESEVAMQRLSHEDDVVRIISDGRAGTVKRRITLILRSREGQLAILDRKEEILP